MRELGIFDDEETFYLDVTMITNKKPSIETLEELKNNPPFFLLFVSENN